MGESLDLEVGSIDADAERENTGSDAPEGNTMLFRDKYRGGKEHFLLAFMTTPHMPTAAGGRTIDLHDGSDV